MFTVKTRSSLVFAVCLTVVQDVGAVIAVLRRVGDPIGPPPVCHVVNSVQSLERIPEPSGSVFGLLGFSTILNGRPVHTDMPTNE